jgi:hypothetical protein
MTQPHRRLLLGGCACLVAVSACAADALRLHPDNPHYFLFRGQPTLIITSGEHYGAVVNLDFDYRKYLDTLAADRLNGTRLFAAYREQPTAFNIAGNSLAPKQDRFIAPWARSTTPGYFDGGNKFDLDRWDTNYFARLKDFTDYAGRRGIIVEVDLFGCFYSSNAWNTHPFQARNNVNGIGNLNWNEALTLQDATLVAVQERYVRKVVEELRDFDNVYYEVCNEPYIGGVAPEWERHITDTIVAAQKSHANPKLISWNIANGAKKILDPHPAVSILNFHYAAPPTAVAQNYGLNRVIGDNETGFRGTNDAPYRMEAWDFLIAGGSLFNNLDYSFTVGQEDGTFAYPATQPGGGSPTFRRQLRYLRDFIYQFDFLRMKPDDTVLKGQLPGGTTTRALVKPGEEFAIYVRTSALPGQYSARWTGTLEASIGGEFTLYTLSNDGVRLWLDDQLVIENWSEHPTTEDKGNVRLAAGRQHTLKLEYFYTGGQAAMKLLWSGPGLTKQIIPASALATPEGQRGLRGEYFADTTLSAPSHVRSDPKIEFEAPGGQGSEVKFADREFALDVELPEGGFAAEWFDSQRGEVARREEFDHPGGTRKLVAPAFEDDIALRIRRNARRGSRSKSDSAVRAVP